MIPFDYQIIRKPRRKTVSISVKPDCSVRVLVPSILPEWKVVKLIQQKSRWVQSKIAAFEEMQRNHKQKEYVSGESFTYLGRNYPLKIVPGDVSDSAKLKNGRFYVHLPTDMSQQIQSQFIVEQLTRWYREHAIVRLRDKTRRYSGQIGISPASVGVKDYKSRWGSCHSDGRIYYNWRIIIAPHSIIDYLVVHELCHLVHGNHSIKFWKLVEAILPDYTERKEWLKLNGIGLKV